MKSRNICNFFALVASAIVLIVLPGTFHGTAYAQTAKQMVGTWRLVSSVNAMNGTQVKPFGDKPLGLAAFTADGHFLQVLMRDDLPKIASNNRGQATAAEAQAIMKGSIGLYGTYSVKGNVLTLKFDGSTFPNWIGTTQTRNLSNYNSKRMTWNVPASSLGGTNELIWERVK
jgi:hypothetical protein